MSEGTPNVTVLMSVYNGLPYLEGAVNSILNQTFSDFEFLIIDDYSNDESREKLKRLENQYERIRVILHSKNRGLGYSLHEGVREAQGKWIARMDDDDISCSHRLERQLEYLSDNPDIDVLGSWVEDIDKEGNKIDKRTYPVEHSDIERIIWTNPLIHPTVIFRKSAIKSVGSYDPSIRKRQDYELWFRCLEGGLRFGNVPELLLKYRFTENYYKRNDFGVAWEQAKMGWKGCWRIGASPIAYLGVGVPVLRSMLPRKLNEFVHRKLHIVDPRRN
jgi:glycosyltransferase involved in cell wall biosynthesis